MHASIVLRLSVFAACASAIAACGGTAAKGDAADVGGSIVVAVQAEPQTLLPPLVAAIDEKRLAVSGRD